MKSESLRPFSPKDKRTLIRQIREYINWYNYHRPQEKLKGMTPMEFRKSYLTK
ncbi:IS3 family transposase [Streptococcus mutans]|uniref:IS3 family transposase n=1 Tax=Streptococcus mutans TaxID=1309 RepID=UPI00321A6896